MDEAETGEETYTNSDGTDRDYTQQEDDPTDEEDEDDDDLGAPAHRPQANTGKVPKRNRSDTMFVAGLRGLEKKKSRQDLHGSQRSERVRIDLTGSRMSKKRQIPTTSHPPVSNPPMALKATEMQILSTDKAVFNLAKPILASVLYTIDPWPSCSQNENALCDSAWSQALDAQTSQLRAVGAMQLYDDITTISGGASKVMDSLTRGIVSSQDMSRLRC